jgi:RNA polymerase sigma-70 factor, ECF subfamily
MGAARDIINTQSFIMASSTEFDELYERHYAAVYRAALRITGNPADAEDALQTVFLRILNQARRPDSALMPEAYFRRAAVNAAVDLLRRKTVRAEVQFDATSLQVQGQVQGEDEALLKERLRHAISRLESNDADLFLLRYVEGFDNGELAEMFSQEKNNIAVRLHRIRQMLQADMEH